MNFNTLVASAVVDNPALPLPEVAKDLGEWAFEPLRLLIE